LKNKILITGGAGFIGSNYVELIIENAEDQIYVLDNLTYAGNLKNLETVSHLPNYNFIKGDICDETLIDSLFKEYQFNKVVHFAAESHVDNSITGPGAFIQTNIVGTFNLLHSAYRLWMNGPNQLKEEYNNARFLHVSTDDGLLILYCKSYACTSSRIRLFYLQRINSCGCSGIRYD
jgi:dTDP-glucose 4,6-dehydratase